MEAGNGQCNFLILIEPEKMSKTRAKTSGMGRITRMIPFALLALWLLMQMPFLSCDPDTLVDIHTRGAWTDEGLYSGTARNFLNTGVIDPYENSLYTRGPLFTFFQIPLFYFFGQSLMVARLMVLLFTALVLFLFIGRKDTRITGTLLLAVGFTQFHLFHFSHYAMAEMMGTSFILMAVLCILNAENHHPNQKKENRNLFFASTLLFIAYALKIQFLYIAFLLPGYTLFNMLFHRRSSSGEAKKYRRQFIVSVFFTGGWMLVYAMLWYLPNYDFYNYVMTREADGRFIPGFSGLTGTARFNFDHLLFVPLLKPLLITGAVALVGGTAWLVISPGSWQKGEKALFFLGLIWLVGEIHKTTMTYMPHRYLVPAYTALSLITAALLSVIVRQGGLQAWLVAAFVLFLAFWQLQYTYQAYGRRSSDLAAVNHYLKKYDWKGKTITGAWGPSAAWGTRAKVFPVWHGFVNDDRVIKARMVIAESDQEDSDRSMQIQGIDIRQLADSSRRFSVWRYQVDFYWLPEK
jgi:hypothetical protein